MAIRRADFEYYVSNDEIIISDVVDKNLEVLDIPSHINRFPVVAIESGVFRFMPKLNTVYLPHTMDYIGNYAFANCPELRAVKSMSTYLMISGGAFLDCENLVHFQTEKELHLQTAVFKGCVNLQNLDGHIASFAKDTFAQCVKLGTLIFAEQVSRFHGEAFTDCVSLCRFMFLGNLGQVIDSVSNGCLQNIEFICGKNSDVADLAMLGYRVGIRDYL